MLPEGEDVPVLAPDADRVQPVLAAEGQWEGWVCGLVGLAAFPHPAMRTAASDGLVAGYVSPPEHACGAALEALCGVLPRG